MDKYIIFSTPMVWVLLSVVVLAYVVETVLHRLISAYRKKIDTMVSNAQKEQIKYKIDYYNAAQDFKKISSLSTALAVMKICSVTVALINLAVHVSGFIGLLFIKAKLEETLFLLIISIALALTANRIKGEE